MNTLMESRLKGVRHIKKENCSVFYITSLTEDLKSVIISRLSSICFGAAAAASNQVMYCYKNTLKEFIERYSGKSENYQKGMIGELLLHILIAELLNEFQIDSPFFNLEERSIKKGFDVILNKQGSPDIWLAEVKSGEIHSGKNSSETAIELISTAQNDLDKRLNEESFSLWLNAVHDARIAIDNSRDDRDAIISILECTGAKASESGLSSTDFNVILSGTLFHPLSDYINMNDVTQKQIDIINSKTFNDVYVVAIQKKTYTAVYNFLKSESEL